MKKIITLTAFVLIATIYPLQQAVAQSPDKMSYQAVIRDASSTLVTNSNIGMQISVLQSSATGLDVYVERHFPTTNSNGLVSIEIGTGILVSGDFASIDWSDGSYFIKTETDLNGGANYTITGTSQILSVPYALHAKYADSVSNFSPQSNTIMDADGDTKIQVEASPDEDIIRFDMAGTEFFHMDNGRLEVFNTGKSVFIGEGAGASDDLAGSQNIAIGYQSLASNTTGVWNTAVGYQTLFSNTSSTRSSAFGYQALRNNTSGYRNTAIGFEALYSNTGGYFNTAIGYRSLYSNIHADCNTATGYEALAANISGAWNSAYGMNSLSYNTIGMRNSAFGYHSLHDNTTGERNTATGYNSLGDNITGDYNTAVGYSSISNNSAGDYNTAVGYSAFYDNLTGSYNTAIGYSTNVGFDNLTNATAIGARAYVNADNSLVLGSINGVNGATSDARVGIGTTSPDESAILELSSTSKGFLLPRMSVMQRNAISNPTEGLLIFNTTSDRLNICIAGTWYGISIDSVTPPPPPPAWDTVYNPATGRYWMDRNLGASQVATSSTDAASYGDIYQWGRAAEGHEIRTSVTTATQANTAIPNAGNDWDGYYITPSDDPWDWLTVQTDTLWQGVNGFNNPCPEGFRIPTMEEWHAERLSWSSLNAVGAYNSPLKLPVAGRRNVAAGTLYYVGTNGYYWTSTFIGSNVIRMVFTSDETLLNETARAAGLSVRCIKEE